MADVARLPGLWEQIRLVAGLRWRILRNGMRSKSRRWDLIGVVIAGLFGAAFVIAVTFAFYAGTVALLSSGRDAWMGLLFWAIFLWWQVFPIFVAGFSPSFSFRTLLRFPLKFPAFYLIAIAYGLADSSAVAGLCWMAAMVVGVATAKAALLPVMLMTCGFFLVMNVTLERLLGAWLEKILAKRRSRELFFGLFLLLIVGVQFLGPAIEKYSRTAKPVVARLFPYVAAFPGSLAGRAIAGTSQHDGSRVALSLAGLCGYALLFGGLLWRRLAIQYRGEELSETSAPQLARKKASAANRGDVSAAPSLPILPPGVSAVFQKEVKYVLRNGFVLVSMLFPPILVLFLSVQFAGGARHRISADLFFPGMIAYVMLILMAASYNCFAFEGRGIQTYFMVPVKFRDVLLGKNLMQVSMLGAELGMCIVVVALRAGLPSRPVLVATLAAVVFAVVGQLTIANWSSLSFPKKMEFGKMKGQRQSGMAVLISFGAQLVFGAVCGVILFAGRWTGNVWLPAEIFAFLAAAALGGYFASLDGLTRLAERKKELLLETLGK